ncbi:MAG: thiol:disulfide interchange protein DsbA/DsbL [Pseudomonadota bacterium]
MIRRLFSALLLALPVMLIASAPAKAQEFSAGTDFALVSPALPAGGAGKVEVVELFWYGCPHCYQFEPLLKEWLAEKPANVEFVRIPAIFNRASWKLHAHAYYTAEVLGVMEQFHKPFFDAIHQQGKRLNTQEAIRQFFDGIGVDGDTFDKTFESFAVQAKVRRAADLTRQSGITGVPSIMVNGKYRTGGSMSKTFPRMIEITEALVEKES